jgi:2-dehydro-3-deoxyphosphogluconate aldolase/(4S)-4-hydroxy-2-oxoglutarate aldolase
MAVLRAPTGRMLSDAADALLAGGVEAIEISFTVPDAPDILRQMADRLGEKIVLGAGTVLDTETARTALMAGAQFIVAPTTNIEVIRLCHRYDKVVMPGALTPTEVLTAWEAGADIVKVFPSHLTGPTYISALLAPLPQVRLMPVGGVNLQTAADYVRAGASVLGLGTTLVEPKALAAGDMRRIESLARQYVEIVKNARQSMD